MARDWNSIAGISLAKCILKWRWSSIALCYDKVRFNGGLIERRSIELDDDENEKKNAMNFVWRQKLYLPRGNHNEGRPFFLTRSVSWNDLENISFALLLTSRSTWGAADEYRPNVKEVQSRRTTWRGHDVHNHHEDRRSHPHFAQNVARLETGTHQKLPPVSFIIAASSSDPLKKLTTTLFFMEHSSYWTS